MCSVCDQRRLQRWMIPGLPPPWDILGGPDSWVGKAQSWLGRSVTHILKRPVMPPYWGIMYCLRSDLMMVLSCLTRSTPFPFVLCNMAVERHALYVEHAFLPSFNSGWCCQTLACLGSKDSTARNAHNSNDLEATSNLECHLDFFFFFFLSFPSC